MKQVLHTERGKVPIKTTDMNAGNANLARQMAAAGSTVVDSHSRNAGSSAPTTSAASAVSYAEKDPTFYDVSDGLPSKFIFYPQDITSLSIRPLRIPEAKKIFQGQTLKSMRIMVEAVSACLQPGLSAFDLTRGDYYYLLYWLRIQSFKKSPYTLTAVCTSYDHIEKVVNEELSRDSLIIEQIVHKVGELNVTSPDFNKVEEQIQLIRAEYGLDCYPPLMRDIVDIDELDQKDEQGNTLSDDQGNPLPPSKDVLWTAKYASVLSPFKHGRTLQERMAIFDSLDLGPDLLGDLDYLIKLFDHGVQERASVACKECGAKMDVSVSINALSFFPAVQRA